MVPFQLSSFLKLLTTITLLFLFFQSGFSREMMMRSSKGVERFTSTPADSLRFNQESRKMMELDYEDAGPNTNGKSGFSQLPPYPEAPATPLV